MKKPEELEHWIALWRVSGIGSKYYQKLLACFDSPSHVFSSSASAITQAGLSQNLANTILDHRNTSESAKPDIDWLLSSENNHIITIECEAYPKLLKRISDPPPILYVHGNLECLNDPQLGIIGSRNPTQSGMNSAYEFSKHLGQTGLCITSGLALGIDGMAHQGALDGHGPTIAVIATGIDRVYPAKHRDLAHKIAEKGAIVSEFPLGTPPNSRNFPRRNRIISGLSYGTLVVEAAQKSGSLITARLAMEQNREVFAIPGSIHNPLARGCHQLIRQGAKLVETAQDILEEMATLIDISAINNTQHQTETSVTTSLSDENNTLDEEQQYLLTQMEFDPITVDELVTRTDLDAASIAAMLLILELQNYVSSSGAGTYTRLRNF